MSGVQCARDARAEISQVSGLEEQPSAPHRSALHLHLHQQSHKCGAVQSGHVRHVDAQLVLVRRAREQSRATSSCRSARLGSTRTLFTSWLTALAQPNYDPKALIVRKMLASRVFEASDLRWRVLFCPETPQRDSVQRVELRT